MRALALLVELSLKLENMMASSEGAQLALPTVEDDPLTKSSPQVS